MLRLLYIYFRCNHQLGNNFIGTVQTKRLHLPNKGNFPYRGKQMERGTMRCMETPSLQAKTPQSLFFTAWQDRQPVHLLSTI